MGLWVAFSVAVLSVPGFTRLDARDDMLLDMNIPQRAIELCQRGVLLSYEGRAEEMLEAFDQSLSIINERSIHFHRACALLRLGMWEAGWREWQLEYLEYGKSHIQWWHGEPVESVSVFYDGGWGDRLQFMRYLRPLKKKVSTVYVGEPGSLVHKAQAYASVLGLPYGLHLYDPAESPRAPYLELNPQSVEWWKSQLSSLDGFKVGICWQGDPSRSSEPHRSIPLKHFLSLRDVPNVTLLSLQKGLGVEQLYGIDGIINLDPRVDEWGRPPFGDTGSVIANLDLIIASDTAIAHLAGGLGKPVWLALPFFADWRWMTRREDSPWYPSMRIFRQRRPGDWAEVFIRVADELRKLA